MIPDAAVEAAAEWLPHSGDCEVRPERDCTCWQSRVDLMRAALEAAGPHLLEDDAEDDAQFTPDYKLPEIVLPDLSDDKVWAEYVKRAEDCERETRRTRRSYWLHQLFPWM